MNVNMTETNGLEKSVKDENKIAVYPEWIKIEDQLPPVWQDVLVTAIDELGFNYEKGERYIAIDRRANFKDTHEINFRTNRMYGKVTHWMLPPDLPKVEK